WVKFPVRLAALPGPGGKAAPLAGASLLIWTTTPWTLPGNRAVSFSPKIAYGLYEVTAAPAGNWAKPAERYILADRLAPAVFKAARIEPDGYRRLASVSGEDLQALELDHPLRAVGYGFRVPLLAGDHVTDEDGTGFVHTAPGHGREDFDVFVAHAPELDRRGIDTAIPFTVDGDGRFTKDAPGFEGKRVIDDSGNKGDANEAVIEALLGQHALIARGRLKHAYPHSWRSKKPVIFRNTPQWFIAMDKPLLTPSGPANDTLREAALKAIAVTEFVPATGRNRLRGMVEAKPDWVISRQRAWGVPITVFQHVETGEVIPSPQFAKSNELMARIRAAMTEEGADAWFDAGAQQRFLKGLVANPGDWQQITDILDVWFDSGSTHTFTLEDPEAFPQLAGVTREVDGGRDRVMYLEGSDQHRGWFQSSLLESCGTRGRAPFDIVLTHGFILDEKGEEKMSKSRGNTLSPQQLMQTSGADILRLWVASSDYSSDIRFGPGILQGTAESYRKLRNTLRWMLGNLAHHSTADTVAPASMPELERLMLHRLAELSDSIRKAYDEYDYKRVIALLSQFMNTDLSAFYFDIRKDALYCEPYSSAKRRAALATIEHIFRATTLWLAPLLCFTAEEAWLARYPSEEGSVHLETFAAIPADWRDDKLADKWARVRRVRSVITGALEIERANKRIGASLEAAPVVFVADPGLREALAGVDLAEIAITSDIDIRAEAPPADAFTLPEVAGVGVVSKLAEGRKCARSWRITQDVGADPAFPTLSARDAAAVKEFDRLKGAA
ncbi:MAG TPA: class I tRNA ligase family protein, partial [Hyphomicrobiaceae bacterium]|nr:class I tRNA ligase family protein [Hyphomicrobiaceae bacterium]